MSETVVIRQDSEFRTEFLAAEAGGREGAAPGPVSRIHELTPYGMLLAGLGSCTAILLHSYAGNRKLPLREVELRLEYERRALEDCRDCDPARDFSEVITVEVTLRGEISPADREKLLQVSGRCPVHKMLEGGVRIESRLAPEGKDVKAP